VVWTAARQVLPQSTWLRRFDDARLIGTGSRLGVRVLKELRLVKIGAEGDRQ
jgi:hypothetical protein